jgi:hypothetical protein
MIRFSEYEKKRLRTIVPVSALRQMTALRHSSASSVPPAIMAGVLGPIIVHKKVILDHGFSRAIEEDKVIALMLPAGAVAHISLNADGKCRADMAICREAGTSHRSSWDGRFVYAAGLLTPKSPFSDELGRACGSGIHFFFRRRDAVEYVL